MNFDKCGIAMASNGNMSSAIQLIIDVVGYRMAIQCLT